MATVYELGLNIGDSISFPLRNPHEYGFDPKDRHIAKIVGPHEFPDCDTVYLAPPKPEGSGNIWVYNPETNITRSTQKNERGYWESDPPRGKEILVQGIHTGYILFERV